MVEVFKTNVEHPHHAKMLIDQIKKAFANYVANFDLEDCDRILRVKCVTGVIKCTGVINLMNELGFHAEVLTDEPVTYTSINFMNSFYSRRNQLN